MARRLRALLGAALLLSACGGGASTSTATSTTHGSTPAATATPGGAGVACLPEDTPVAVARQTPATAAIAAVWAARQVDIVPACSVLTPHLEQFANLTGPGGLSDAEARKIADARMVTEQLAVWGGRTRQLHVSDFLSPTSVYSVDALEAVNSGAYLVDRPDVPGCTIARRIAVVRVDQRTLASIPTSASSPSPTEYQPLAEYGVPGCQSIAITNGREKVLATSNPQRHAGMVVGAVKSYSDLGINVWYEVGGAGCDDSILAATCREAGY